MTCGEGGGKVVCDMLVYKGHLNVYKGPTHTAVVVGVKIYTKRCTVIISQYQLAKSAAEEVRFTE